MAESGSNKYLRIAAQGGGCNGISYKLSFTDKPTKDDYVLNGSFGIVIDIKSVKYVSSLEIDYSDGLDGKGFEFANPLAKGSCGCGTSFKFD